MTTTMRQRMRKMKMKKTCRSRLFAIRISRDWVELRSCKTVIKGIKTTVVKKIPETYYKKVISQNHLGPGYWDVLNFVEARRMRNIKISCNEWLGGRKLGLYKAGRVLAQLRCCPDIGMATEVNPTFATLGLQAKWRERLR